MKQSTIKKYIQFLTEVKNSGKTLYEYCNNKCWEENNGIKYEYKSLINNINALKRVEPNKDIQEILNLYSEMNLITPLAVLSSKALVASSKIII